MVNDEGDKRLGTMVNGEERWWMEGNAVLKRQFLK
jgi:hypothetical protein